MSGTPRAGTPEDTTGHVIRDSSLGLVPETLPALLDLQAAIWHRSSVGPALLEVLRLRNARTVNCVFCKSVRYDIARADGLTEAKVAQIDDDFATSDAVASREAGALVRGRLSAASRAFRCSGSSRRCAQEFTAEELAHMAIALATFHALSRCAVSLGGMPESLPVMEMSVPV